MVAQVKVLVVDDEEIVLKSMRRILKKDDEHEFLVDTASSAADGLALVKGKKYDVIITDLMMPKMDGMQFIDGIRRSDHEHFHRRRCGRGNAPAPSQTPQAWAWQQGGTRVDGASARATTQRQVVA